MGRKKINKEEKRYTISVHIPNDLITPLEDIKNKSKFIEWLLVEHFNQIQKTYGK